MLLMLCEVRGSGRLDAPDPRLPQERQRLPRRRRRGGAAGRRRQAEPSNHPRTAQLLDLGLGPEVFCQGTQAAHELVSNNLADFRLKKGLDHLDTVRQRFQTITDRFAGFQAQWLNVHVDFPLLQRLALPITIGAVRYPGIKIHDPRVIRLLEVLLHGGSHVGGWTAKHIHHTVLTTFHLSDSAYRLNQLRYDLRKLKGHGLGVGLGLVAPVDRGVRKGLAKAERNVNPAVAVLAAGLEQEHAGRRATRWRSSMPICACTG
jgi:hypothetical protein